MVPEAMLPYRRYDNRIEPDFLSVGDLPWVSLLMDEFGRFEGKPKKLLEEYFKQPLDFNAPRVKLRLVRYVLQRLWRADVRSAFPPTQIRYHLFSLRSQRALPRSAIVTEVAHQLGITSQEVEQGMFADLRGERVMVAPEEAITPQQLMLQANLALVQGLLARSTRVCLRVLGSTRPIVRHAKFKGLICCVRPSDKVGMSLIDISGPLTLFRKTLLYGRALGELVPFLAWCNRFALHADVMLKSGVYGLQLRSGIPIAPAKRTAKFDSKVEERFARDFGKLTTSWSVIREPQPIRAGDKLIFPDFVLRSRHDPTQQWHLEIVGFWTREYLRTKLKDLRRANLRRLILCIDEKRQCADDDLPFHARVLFYKTRIDAKRVLRMIDADGDQPSEARCK